MICTRCKKKFGGSGIELKLGDTSQIVCADCYSKVKEEYRKKRNCVDCTSFQGGYCNVTKDKLLPMTFLTEDFYVEAEKCPRYSTEEARSPEDIIDDLETAGRYEDAAQECEKLGLLERAGRLRRESKKITVAHADANVLVKQLADKGQTLTYHCCHCGAPLKIGAKSIDILKTCPNCGYSLEIIDLAKLINQHMRP